MCYHGNQVEVDASWNRKARVYLSKVDFCELVQIRCGCQPIIPIKVASLSNTALCAMFGSLTENSCSHPWDTLLICGMYKQLVQPKFYFGRYCWRDLQAKVMRKVKLAKCHFLIFHDTVIHRFMKQSHRGLYKV